MRSPVTNTLLDWYQKNSRDLPWRGSHDPYAIWISEIMLQQTRVETVAPYFERWIERFPNIKTLAEAPLQEILAAWEGLGYYSRAHNLHKTAQILINEYGGQLPKEPWQLEKLPGIGRYTAGAIASIAFNKDTPALDGNIRRVLARLFDVQEPAQSPAGQARLWNLAAQHLPSGQAGDYSQALMDLGASICTPRAPACPRCPMAEYCLARERGIQDQRPVLRARPSIPHYIVTAAVIASQGKVLIAQRPNNGLLGGLWEFPGGKLEDGEDLARCLKREICEELGVDIQVGAELGIYRHAYTHFRVTLHAFACQVIEDQAPTALEASELRWVTPGELKGYPMGKLDRQISHRILSN